MDKPNKYAHFRLLGAVAGDVIGSRFEWNPVKTTDFPLFHPDCTFTDDTILTVAVASAILQGGSFAEEIWDFGSRYPDRGFGNNFMQWLSGSKKEPYNSYGNGSALRVSPVAWAYDTVDDVLENAYQSAIVTHNHPEGIKGAQSVALAVFMARQKKKKDEIRAEITRRFGYDLNRTLAEIRPTYSYDVTCQGCVPEAIIAFLESTDYESTLRNAISLGGDADTQAAIAGSIAEAYYDGVPEEIMLFVKKIIPEEFWLIIKEFNTKFVHRD